MKLNAGADATVCDVAITHSPLVHLARPDDSVPILLLGSWLLVSWFQASRYRGFRFVGVVRVTILRGTLDAYRL